MCPAARAAAVTSGRVAASGEDLEAQEGAAPCKCRHLLAAHAYVQRIVNHPDVLRTALRPAVPPPGSLFAVTRPTTTGASDSAASAVDRSVILIDDDAAVGGDEYNSAQAGGGSADADGDEPCADEGFERQHLDEATEAVAGADGDADELVGELSDCEEDGAAGGESRIGKLVEEIQEDRESGLRIEDWARPVFESGIYSKGAYGHTGERHVECGVFFGARCNDLICLP